MNFQSTDFELFGAPVQFAQDRALLDAKWKGLQREVHPDKFASHGSAAQRVAMQWSVRINEAYQRLKDPLKRAAYLCELNGALINAENNTAMSTDFLIQQIEWREALEGAETVEEIEKIAREAHKYGCEKLLEIEHLIDSKHDFLSAVTQVRNLMFIERFQTEVETRFDQLEQ
jgi:molecular chaperone HscB